MLKINISPINKSDSFNIGRTAYNIEYLDSAWIFKKVESKIIIKRNKDKNKLRQFAIEYCGTHNSEICVRDMSGKTEEVINF